MKIIGIALVGFFLILCTILVFGEQAQAYDPRAEVPGATITGIILDANGDSIPNATVKLFLDGRLFDIPGNPQQSSQNAGEYGSIGRYQFMRLPYDQYLIAAEAPDASGKIHRSNLTVNVNANTMTADIVISDLVNAMNETSSPSSPLNSSFCSAGLVLPLLGICTLMISRKKAG